MSGWTFRLDPIAIILAREERIASAPAHLVTGLHRSLIDVDKKFAIGVDVRNLQVADGGQRQECENEACHGFLKSAHKCLACKCTALAGALHATRAP